MAYFSVVLVYRDDELALALQTGLFHLEQPIFEDEDEDEDELVPV